MGLMDGMGGGAIPTYSVGDGNNNGDGMGGIWGILLLVLILGGGMGGLGGGLGGGAGSVANTVNNDFIYSNLNNSLGRLADATSNGFSGVKDGICNLGYTNLANFKDLSSQIANCCCETNRNIDAIRYENAKNTCDILNAVKIDGDATRTLITSQEMQRIRDELNTANLQLSQQAQSANLISTLRPVSSPAYITCSPYTTNNCNPCC